MAVQLRAPVDQPLAQPPAIQSPPAAQVPDIGDPLHREKAGRLICRPEGALRPFAAALHTPAVAGSHKEVVHQRRLPFDLDGNLSVRGLQTQEAPLSAAGPAKGHPLGLGTVLRVLLPDQVEPVQPGAADAAAARWCSTKSRWTGGEQGDGLSGAGWVSCKVWRIRSRLLTGRTEGASLQLSGRPAALFRELPAGPGVL